jgi:hypothetical protein
MTKVERKRYDTQNEGKRRARAAQRTLKSPRTFLVLRTHK